MGDLAAQLAEVQQNLETEKGLGSQKDNDKITALEQQETALKAQIDEENAKQSQVARIQEQADKVESITLPYDFNEVFADPRANEMIIELIKDLQLQAYADHNAEVEQLTADHKAELGLYKTQNDEFRRENDELKVDLGVANKHIVTLETSVMDLVNERDDAFAKRDAAVREKEGIELLVSEKQAQIDTLRAEIAVGAKAAINVTNISPSDKLAALVQESKNAKVKSAIDIALENTAPFRGKVISDGAVVQLNAPQVDPFPLVNQASDTVSGVDTAEPVSVPTENQPVTFPEQATEVRPESATVATGQPETSTESKTLEDRVKALELHVFGA